MEGVVCVCGVQEIELRVLQACAVLLSWAELQEGTPVY
jgi:hypothetical protein